MSVVANGGKGGMPTWATWAGRIMSGIVVGFLLIDGAVKVLDLAVVGETLNQLGYPASLARGLGLLTLLIAVLYAFPKTAFLGAVLLTGLLGGAMATHLRVGSPLFTHLLFGLYIGVLAWAGLWLRDARLRAVTWGAG
ncbi:MAG: hypothetical protein JWN93_3400 [Hyphomicrobiales bacterium]|nr:hypothetical protein [Hyphomicrobiales bacterium]